ncbi:MAG: hypothetical protein J1E42_08330 [Akkermansiaceae bacterium]|nr:hypothetical protein [Akkermansiaceae bacterium]
MRGSIRNIPAACIRQGLWAGVLLAAVLLPTAPARLAPPLAAAAADSRQDAPYWINSQSGKTHNRSCRYYAHCKGRPSQTPSGNNCKICGGARKP